jgi:hypothetical protein
LPLLSSEISKSLPDISNGISIGFASPGHWYEVVSDAERNHKQPNLSRKTDSKPR